jgi:hypothetical protein
MADASWSFHSVVLVSRDEGTSWVAASAAPTGILADGNVHDAFPIARKDEGADVYYVREATDGQTVWRRALHEDGSFGPEQGVTSTALGSVAKPQPRRLPDGRIAMMLALEHDPTDQDLALVVLDGDASP